MDMKQLMKFKPKFQKLFEEMKSSPVATGLFTRFNGVTAQEAYDNLKKLSDEDLRVIAVIIGKVNNIFRKE